MPWALLQRIDSLEDSLCHPHKSHSMYQAVFGSLESVATFEYMVHEKRGCFLYFQQTPWVVFCCLRERYRNISFNTYPEKTPGNPSLLCENRILSCSLLIKYVITWKYSVFCGMYYLLTQPFWTWGWFWAPVFGLLAFLAIENPVNQTDNLTLFCSPSVSLRASSLLARPRFLVLGYCILLWRNK